MKRDYKDEVSSNIEYFIGNEVEKTPVYGMRTLFVVGIKDPEEIMTLANLNKCEHVFFGANHSYNPQTSEEFEAWEQMLLPLLKEGVICSLDIPSTINMEWFLDGGLTEYDNFIPQIRVVIPYVKQWNYNTMVKIDDKDFKASNPGVWCHSLHDLMDKTKFTPWTSYKNDEIIELTDLE